MSSPHIFLIEKDTDLTTCESSPCICQATSPALAVLDSPREHYRGTAALWKDAKLSLAGLDHGPGWISWWDAYNKKCYWIYLGRVSNMIRCALKHCYTPVLHPVPETQTNVAGVTIWLLMITDLSHPCIAFLWNLNLSCLSYWNKCCKFFLHRGGEVPKSLTYFSCRENFRKGGGVKARVFFVPKSSRLFLV